VLITSATKSKGCVVADRRLDVDLGIVVMLGRPQHDLASDQLAVRPSVLPRNDGLNWPHCTVPVGPREAVVIITRRAVADHPPQLHS